MTGDLLPLQLLYAGVTNQYHLTSYTTVMYSILVIIGPMKVLLFAKFTKF